MGTPQHRSAYTHPPIGGSRTPTHLYVGPPNTDPPNSTHPPICHPPIGGSRTPTDLHAPTYHARLPHLCYFKDRAGCDLFQVKTCFNRRYFSFFQLFSAFFSFSQLFSAFLSFSQLFSVFFFQLFSLPIQVFSAFFSFFQVFSAFFRFSYFLISSIRLVDS